MSDLQLKRRAEGPFLDDNQPKRPKAKAPSIMAASTSTLCAVCVNIDFEEAFNLTVKISTGTFISSLSSMSEYSKCRLSRFFCRMLPPTEVDEISTS